MKKFRFLSQLMAVSILFTSCASILNGKQQKIAVHTNSEDSRVLLNGKLEGEGKVVETVVDRNAKTQQITIEREGYKDQNLVVFQEVRSPLYILSWVPFGILLYPPLYDVGPKAFNYNKEVHLKKEDQLIDSRKDSEKYVYIEKTGFDLEEEGFQIKSITGRNYLKGKEKYKELNSNDEKIAFDNSIFSSTLNDLLLKYNYIDTTGTILKKKTNSLYVNATVKSVDIYDISSYSARRNQQYLSSEVTIEWELTDIYGQPQYNEVIKGDSGEFKVLSDLQESVFNCLNDAVTSSYLKFMSAPELRQLLYKEANKPINFEDITLTKGSIPSEIEQAMQASVTVKTNLGHGSGFVVSSDGYIVTNLHVVANAKKIEVFSTDQIPLEAVLIRQNEYKDLALLKVDKAFAYSFPITSDKNYKIGDDIYAIGTPNSIQLGQSLSKGIISGERNSEEDSYIQIDASVNNGNSGGAMINGQGNLLGVVNSKVSGIGVEGIGFAIPAYEIGEALFIK